MKLSLRILLAAFCVLIPAFGSGIARAETTLEKIKRTGVVTVGHRESSVPFSYYDSAQNVIGHAQDYSSQIVEAIKTKLAVPNLAVKMVPVTSQNRIPLLQNSTYDFECGSTTNNLERQKQVSFSNSFFVVGTRLLTNKNSGIKDFADLKNRTVVVAAGTTSEKQIHLMKDRDKLDVTVISVPDFNDAFRAVETGRAHAFFIDDVLLAGERSRAKTPTDWVIVGTPQSFEAYGCMVRKDDTEFKALVDAAVAKYQTSGQAEQSYKKWFQSPIPPRGANMQFELSSAMRELYKTPNDKAYQ